MGGDAVDTETFDVAAAETLLADVFAPWVQALNLKPLSFSPSRAVFLMPENAALSLRGGPGAGVICGQTVAAVADTACVLALAGANGRYRNCTTIDLACNYLRPLRQGDVDITVDMASNGRKLAVCRASIAEAGRDKPSALATCTFLYLEE